MFFKYVNSDGQPAVFGPFCKVRTPHVPGSETRSSRITFQDDLLERPLWLNASDTTETEASKTQHGC